jgi:death on curing protein
MITRDEVLRLHTLSIKKYGGADGIRDNGLLESAIARPYQTFGGEFLYVTIFEKAAAITESLIINHPFVDGNKRTGFLGLFAVLNEENYFITAEEDDLYDLTIKISTGEIKLDEIVEWLKNNTEKF